MAGTPASAFGSAGCVGSAEEEEANNKWNKYSAMTNFSAFVSS